MPVSKARKAIITAVMRDTIFEAAGSVLEQHGVGGMTMDRVATTAGLTAGSLYNYFHNKDDLMQSVYTRLVEPFFQAIEETSNADLPAPEKVKTILLTARDSAIKNRGLLQFLAGENHDRSQLRRDTRPRFHRVLKAVFEQGIREGSFRSHNPAHSSRMFQGCLSELFELQGDKASNQEVNEFADLMIDAILGEFSSSAKESARPGEATPHPNP
jgi:AcrR family transcriptional regulator